MPQFDPFAGTDMRNHVADVGQGALNLGEAIVGPSAGPG